MISEENENEPLPVDSLWRDYYINSWQWRATLKIKVESRVEKEQNQEEIIYIWVQPHLCSNSKIWINNMDGQKRDTVQASQMYEKAFSIF